MKKLVLSLCLLLALPIAAQKKTFKAACLNVDGLPPTVEVTGITTVNLNQGGPQAVGTSQISKLVAQKGWDFIAVSENFNYNDELMSEIGSHYNAATYRGSIPTKLNGLQALEYVELNGFSIREDRVKKPFDTDGLNLLFKNTIRIADEAMYGWNQKYGVTKNGADLLIDKGYRYYCVKIDNGLEVDLYILHMDAETSEADNAARASQITQLADMIIASDNKRPIIIMGDTNCRYTRDNLKGLLFDRINSDPRFEIHDPWIDFPRQGEMPQLGAPSIMVPETFDGTNHEAFQTGEVVDKVFYINNKDADGVTLTANSYLQDTDFTWPDGSEISDHYPIVINFTIENTGTNVKGGEYYLRNRATGTFLAAGAYWDTHAVLSPTGKAFTLTPYGSGDADFIISSSLGIIEKNDIYLDKNEAYFNGTNGQNPYFTSDNPYQKAWTLEKNTNGDAYFITYIDNGIKKAIDVEDDMFIVNPKNFSGSESQQWELLTQSELIKELYGASDSNPKDATFLFKGYNIGRNDPDADIWTNSSTLIKASKVSTELGGPSGSYSDNQTLRIYNKGIVIGKNSIWNLTKTDNNLPNGLYQVSCQIFSDNNNATLSFNETSIAVPRVNNSGNTSVASAAASFKNGEYIVSTLIRVTDHTIVTKIGKPDGNTSAGAVFFDNFKLTYLGETAEDRAALDKVKAAIDDAQAKADAMNLWNYDNSTVMERYENRAITGDGSPEVRMTYIQLATAAKSQSAIPADMRYAILNNSFEMGDLSEWNASGAANPQVISSMTAPDGNYIFTADGGELLHTLQVTMAPGIYRLTANLSAGACLVAGDRRSEPASGEGMNEVSVNFPISAGTATIGVTADCAFSADNFILTRIGSAATLAAYDILPLAIADATAKSAALGSPLDLSAYQAMIDNQTLTGDGWTEFHEIYGLLRQLVLSQEGENIDVTYALVNNSFEWGNLYGWESRTGGDTKVTNGNLDDVYMVDNTDGIYLYNAWDGDFGARCITQTITGMKAGEYILNARITSDSGNTLYLGANGEYRPVTAVAKNHFEEVSVRFTVNRDGAPVTFGVFTSAEGADNPDATGPWYKADNFTLTLISEAPALEWTMEGDLYDTIMLPFEAECPDGLEIYDALIEDLEIFDTHAIAHLTPAGTTIAANTPYVVKSSAYTAAAHFARVAGQTFTFHGYPANVANTYTSGILTGTHIATTAGKNQHVMVHNMLENSNASWFNILAKDKSVAANHAYVDTSGLDTDTPVNGYNIYLEEHPGGGSTTGIEDVTADNAGRSVFRPDTRVRIYTITGIMVCDETAFGDALERLTPGVYIITDGVTAIKLVN